MTMFLLMNMLLDYSGVSRSSAAEDASDYLDLLSSNAKLD
jgi:hypothetical protein